MQIPTSRTDSLSKSCVEWLSEKRIGKTSEEQFDETGKNVWTDRLQFVNDNFC